MNTAESVNARFKNRHQGTDGEDRMRIYDMDSVRALCELAALSFAAATAFVERRENGVQLHLAVPDTGTIAPGQGIGTEAA